MELWVGQHVQNEWKCLISMYDAARSMYYDITMFDKQFDCTPQLNKMQPHCLGRWSLNTMSNTIYNESNFYSIFASTYQKKKKTKKNEWYRIKPTQGYIWILSPTSTCTSIFITHQSIIF